MSSLRSFLDAVRTFGDSIGQISLEPLMIALLLHVTNLTFRTRAWFNIVRAAYPGERYRWRSCAGAYLSGVGVNSFAPARGGDLVKIYITRLRLPVSRTPTILATLIVETMFDSVVGSCILVYAITLGVFPSLPSLPSLPAFEWSWVIEHKRLAGAIAFLVAVVVVFVSARALRVVRDFWDRVRQGFTILRRPRRFLLQVVLPQAIGWCCRVASAVFFLKAFHIPGTVHNALLVLVVIALSTLLPFTPGGVGTQQVLITVVLAGVAPDPRLVSFSVGMQVAMTTANIVIGVLALALTFRSFSIRRAIREARAHHRTATNPPPAET